MTRVGLKGARAIITGAARGIGHGIARRFSELFAEMTDDYIADRKQRIPMGRFCTIEEFADMIAFAASRECSFTTGFMFDITCGRATY